MKLYYSLLFPLVISCSFPPKNDTTKNMKIENNCPDFKILYPQEIFTLYQKKENNFNLIKAFQVSVEKIEVNFISIKPQKGFEPLQQNLTKKENYTIEEIESFEKKYKNIYSWKPHKKNDVLFIQIQPTKEILGKTEDIDLRNDIEDLIDKEFQKTNVGDFFAADLGPGGLNMLCSYKDEMIAMKSILKVLCENRLEKNTLIIKRIATEEDNWIYEVVYPKGFSGKFNSL